MGERTLFNGGRITLSCGEQGTHIKIGADCLFASDIVFTISDNHVIYDLADGHVCNPPGDIVLENHIWVCRSATVLNNTLVSADSVIASHALVTRKFREPNVVIGGVPAKIIRHGCNWKR